MDALPKAEQTKTKREIPLVLLEPAS